MTTSLPPVDPDALARGFSRVVEKERPPGGWPGKPPKEARADTDEGDGE